MEKKIWFVGDTHFGHDQPFIWESRGFASVQEHDTKIIENWNSIIAPDDEVYHLGDVMLGDNEHGLECLKKLNGHIHIIRGNHDSEARIALYKTCTNVVEVCDAKQLKLGKHHFYCCHYPAITANFDDDKPWAQHLINLFGHTHQQTKFYNDNPYMYCVGLDAHNNYPVKLEQIIDDIRDKKLSLDMHKNLN
jgi:calcineurin-like phosphoesterase family protein